MDLTSNFAYLTKVEQMANFLKNSWYTLDLKKFAKVERHSFDKLFMPQF